MSASFNTDLLAAAKDGQAARLADLLALEPELCSTISEAIVAAAKSGHAECIGLLLPFCDPKDDDSLALRYAASNGHEECVRLLAPLSDPQALSCAAVRLAASGGHVECVRVLLPRSSSDFALASILNSALSFGLTSLLAVLIAHDPNVFEQLDLPDLVLKSLSLGHGDMALFLGSIIDRRAIEANLPPEPLAFPPSPRRI